MNRIESVPTPQSPEQPPLAPYDPPAPAPQAEAWRRALKVVINAGMHGLPGARARFEHYT